ncbi:MAG: DUF4433 domain-containing protein [Acidobacteria bacterium]|nr:DUF4433 domain-containing protein [Acidobacteriota bacterium]
MPKSLEQSLNAESALIFRITHRQNVPWMLENGLYSGASNVRDPDFVSIGNPELITKRRSRAVPLPPGGSLDDYIPFYFTPFSPMLYNIVTGWRGVTLQAREDLVILAASLRKLAEQGHPFVFTDRHAYLRAARFFNRLEDLAEISFNLLRTKKFVRDPNDPESIERYQAEALIFERLPTESLEAIGCYTSEVQEDLGRRAAELDTGLKIVHRPGWFL